MNRNSRIISTVFVVALLFGTGLSAANTSNLTDGMNDKVSDGGGLIQDISSFMNDMSPAFLIILGIILIVGSGVAKIIGYVLIIYAAIKLLLTLL